MSNNRTKWRNVDDVDGGAVVYVPKEGLCGAKRRAAALIRDGKLSAKAPLFMLDAETFRIVDDPTGLEAMVGTIEKIAQDCGFPVVLVVLDTLAACMAGADENGTGEMVKAVKTANELAKRTGANIMLIHHTGKDLSRGMRGANALEGGADTAILLSKTQATSDEAPIITAKVTKQRDLEFHAPIGFTLRQVQLGTDRRGKPITSCVVDHLTDEEAAVAMTRTGKSEANEERKAERAQKLHEAIATAGGPGVATIAAVATIIDRHEKIVRQWINEGHAFSYDKGKIFAGETP